MPICFFLVYLVINLSPSMALDGQLLLRRVHAEFTGVFVAVSVVLGESLDTIHGVESF